MGINITLSNTNLIKSNVVSKYFPGAMSNDFNLYIKLTLQNLGNRFETTILHMGINYVLKLSSIIHAVTYNIMNIANKCKKCGIKNIFVSCFTVANRLYSDFINAVSNALKLNCIKYGFIKNSNIFLIIFCKMIWI